MSAPAMTGQAQAGDRAAACRGDLVVIHLRHHDSRQGGESREDDQFQVGQVTSITRDGQVRLYRPAGDFPADPDWRGHPDRGKPMPAVGFQCAWIMSARRVDVQGALATAACHVWPGHEDHVRGYGTLDEARAALRPHLLDGPWWERLRDAARAWEAARAGARPLLAATASTQGQEFLRLSAAYDAAVTAANDAYRQQHAQAVAQGRGADRG